MRARAGDRIVLRGTRFLDVAREAMVVEANPDGRPPYRVRWTDTGTESDLFPGANAYIERVGPCYPPEYEHS